MFFPPCWKINTPVSQHSKSFYSEKFRESFFSWWQACSFSLSLPHVFRIIICRLLIAISLIKQPTTQRAPGLLICNVLYRRFLTYSSPVATSPPPSLFSFSTPRPRYSSRAHEWSISLPSPGYLTPRARGTIGTHSANLLARNAFVRSRGSD